MRLLGFFLSACLWDVWGPSHFHSGSADWYPEGSWTSHTYTRVLRSVTMADLQMKLLRKKIQKRNEKNKERKLLRQTEEKETGEGGKVKLFGCCCLFSVFLSRWRTSHAKLASLASHGMISDREVQKCKNLEFH